MFRFAFASLALLLPITLLAADWPQWRGPDRNGIARETGLLQEWPEGGPKMRWKRTDIGTGILHAGGGGRQSLRANHEGERGIRPLPGREDRQGHLDDAHWRRRHQ